MSDPISVYVADGQQDTFSFGFPYISEDHVVVEVDGTEVSRELLTQGSVTLSQTPSENSTVVVYRRTPDVRFVDYLNGSIQDADDFDLDSTQILYLAIEARARASGAMDRLPGGSDNKMYRNLDMNGFKIQNLAPPTEPSDALRLADLQDLSLVVPDASEQEAGIIRIATEQEVMDNEGANAAVTPEYLGKRVSESIGSLKHSIESPGPEWLKAEGQLLDSATYPELRNFLGGSKVDHLDTFTGMTSVSTSVTGFTGVFRPNDIVLFNGVYIANDNYRIYTSTDLASWESRPDMNDSNSARERLIETGTSVVYEADQGAHPGSVVVTQDGITFSLVSTGLAEIHGIVFDRGIVYCLSSDIFEPAVYSEDGGQSWISCIAAVMPSVNQGIHVYGSRAFINASAIPTVSVIDGDRERFGSSLSRINFERPGGLGNDSRLAMFSEYHGLAFFRGPSGGVGISSVPVLSGPFVDIPNNAVESSLGSIARMGARINESNGGMLVTCADYELYVNIIDPLFRVEPQRITPDALSTSWFTLAKIIGNELYAVDGGWAPQTFYRWDASSSGSFFNYRSTQDNVWIKAT